MKQKITAVRTILLRGFACILSTVFGISFLLNGSAFSASAAELGDVDGDGSVTIQDACWKPMQKSLPVSPRRFQVT